MLEAEKTRILNEVHILSKCNSHFVVKYYHSCIESIGIYIQMEFCQQSLRDVLNDKDKLFNRQPAQPFNIYEYFLSCEIFRELLQCLEYIHTQNPPIIHRDIKPANILIMQNTSNNTFIKFGDFGLATEYNRAGMSLSQPGTPGNMAPERRANGKYDFKADIHELGLVALKLFEITTM
ncbi:unnamed protein product [Medioppia subpectinata]|uniref:Protein kinase domain-containing protein n=1 Tax=Medioppia subpectinata TaxID=1979941 RepID=A0A7R9KDS8_9ACAR|nr:unnamed protein product [Medioppia subpectinata]CAG2100267.1 unnamed protein product [Medioppia subpectinata]